MTKKRSLAVVGAATITGLLLGGGLAIAMVPTDTPSLTGPQLTSNEYEINRHGLTVGEPNPRDIEDRNLPDLVPVAFDSGLNGYIRTDQVYLPEPQTPAEAVEYMNVLYNDAGELVVTVYEADGKTTLGRDVLATISVDGDIDELWP